MQIFAMDFAALKMYVKFKAFAFYAMFHYITLNIQFLRFDNGVDLHIEN